MEITAEHRAWFKRLKKVLNEVPSGMEIVIIGNNQVCVYEEGALYKRHLGKEFDGWGMDDWEEELFGFVTKRVYPFGEGV